MRLLTYPGYTAEQVRTAVRFHAKRLNSRPATKPFAKAIKAHADAIRAASDAKEDADLEVEDATAEIAVLNEGLAQAFKPLVRALDNLVDSNPNDPRRRRLFAETPSDALKPTVDPSQSVFVDGVLQVLAEDADFVALQPHAAPIEAAHTALKAKIAERAGLMAKVAVADSNLAKVVQAACVAHNESEPDVKKLVGASNKKLVESFFYKFPKAGRAKAEVPPKP